MALSDLDRAVQRMENLVPGFKPGKVSGIQFNVKSNLFELATALAAATKDLGKDAIAVTRAGARYVTVQARLHFAEDIKRPAERGEGAGGRRETGHFTFGGSGAFVQRDIKISDTEFGFGFPDVAQADARTNFVWRSLEFGLPGTRNRSSTLHFAELSQFFPQGTHQLPRRFKFSSDSPSSAVLLLGQGQFRNIREGAGFAGKHFIEQAWNDFFTNWTREYDKVTDRAFRAWK